MWRGSLEGRWASGSDGLKPPLLTAERTCWLLSMYLPTALRACPRGEKWELNTFFGKSMRVWLMVHNVLWGHSGISKYISSLEWLAENGHKEPVQGLPGDAESSACQPQCSQPMSRKRMPAECSFCTLSSRTLYQSRMLYCSSSDLPLYALLNQRQQLCDTQWIFVPFF